MTIHFISIKCKMHHLFQVIRKTGDDHFWAVGSSSSQRCGNITATNPKLFTDEKQVPNAARTLVDALTAESTSSVTGKIIQVSY